MAIALAITTITNSIAALSVTGVTIRDIDEVPEIPDVRKPTFFPNPINFISDFEMKRSSQGGGGTALMEVRYTLNYSFCHSPLGSHRNLAQAYSEMVTDTVAIINKILASDDIAGAVDMTLEAAVFSGPVPDPASNMWHGCDLAFRVLEFVN